MTLISAIRSAIASGNASQSSTPHMSLGGVAIGNTKSTELFDTNNRACAPTQARRVIEVKSAEK